MTGQTIIFTSGDQFLRAGRTKVVGTTWRGIDWLKQTICCDTLTGIYIYSVIDFSLFLLYTVKVTKQGGGYTNTGR